VTDQNGKQTTYAYDDADRLTSVTDAATNLTTYGYDTENNLTSIKDWGNLPRPVRWFPFVFTSPQEAAVAGF
jgi:YD repeat-containing protein